MNPPTHVALYVALTVFFVPLGFKYFGTRYQFVDVVLAAVASGAALLIPNFGGVASYVAMVLVLYWRLGGQLFPDIVMTVAAARLALFVVMWGLASR